MDMDTTLRALNRFGLGARVGERTAIGSPREWLRSQLDSRHAVLAGGADLGEIVDALREFRVAQNARDQQRVGGIQLSLRDIQSREVGAMLTARVTTDAPYVERLVAFWSNHLCVSVVAKSQVAALAGHYERRVVRPHVLGRFTDMVLASAKHPAMLYYLDNYQSIGPGSREGLGTGRGGRARGLNENYARELLELHTVGVDGGYSQEDVEELARILTGWTVSGVGPGGRANERAGFVFRPQQHEPGAKTVMGVLYAAAGVREGEEAIRDLCAHPSTADFVATKLVRHFVADDPPPAAVERIARTFRDTEGDLREVSLALIDLEESWAPEHKKFRTPQDWLVAVFRSVRAEEVPAQMGQYLGQLRHDPWAPAAPDGYGDTEQVWADPDALMNRGELARTLARWLRLQGRQDPRRLLEVVDVEPGDPLETLLADSSIPAPDRMALAIAGPAFQWR